MAPWRREAHYWSGGAIGEVPFHEEALAPEPEKLQR